MYRLTRHARERAREMGLTDSEVIAVVLEAETSYRQTDGKRAGQEIAKKGEYSVVTDPKQKVIITVLFNTQEQYSRGS